MTHFSGFLLLLLFSALLVLILHVILSRSLLGAKIDLSPQIVAFAAIFVGYGAMGLLAWEIYLKHCAGKVLIVSAFYAFLVYSGFAYSYFHLFNMSETARRIKVLSDLFLNGSLGLDSVKSKYTLEEQTHNRLERLLALGQIKKSGGRYFIRNYFFWGIAIALVNFRKVLTFQGSRTKPGFGKV